MTQEEVSAYNEKHKLAGKPDELLHAINPTNGNRDIITRKSLAKGRGWKEHDPNKTHVMPETLSDDVLKAEKERKLLLKKVASLESQLKDKEPPEELPADPPEEIADPPPTDANPTSGADNISLNQPTDGITASSNEDNTLTIQPEDAKHKKKRGRPKGSKNKINA